jgi:hypothetical protein
MASTHHIGSLHQTTENYITFCHGCHNGSSLGLVGSQNMQ